MPNDDEKLEGWKKRAAETCKFSRGYELQTFTKLPIWMRHNSYIVDGYRVSLSLKDTLRSLFHLHNETLNIWTHLLGVIFFGIMMVWDLSTWLSSGMLIDKIVYLIYVLSAQFLLFCSSAFHLFHCLSTTAADYSWFARLDYIGISILIAGSYFSPVYYTFYCEPLVVAFYIGGITILMISAICVTFHPMFEKPGYEVIRASVFLLMGFFGVLCLPHAVLVFGIAPIWGLIWRLGVMGVFYCGGVVVYVSHYPEKVWPGKFDFTVSSHAIWHMFVLGGAFSMYKVVEYCFLNRFSAPCTVFHGQYT